MLDHMPVSIEHEITGRFATEADVRSLREQLGLNASLPVRYGRWLSGALRGELGRSLSTGEPVGQALAASLPVTLELLLLAQLLALALALPVGIAAAWRPGSWWDRLSGTIGFGLASLPPFALAVVLMFLFSLRLRWLPATGFTPLSVGWWQNLRGLLLPALSIALVEWVTLMQVLRSDLIATLQEDFILLARAKGLPGWRIMFRHALRPSCFSLITLVGLHGGNLLGGAVLIENIFSLPGLGRLLLTGLFSQDYPVVAGCVLVIALGYVLVTFSVDLCYGALDPRLRREGADG
ncbi:ABC transporter permease [Geomonas sp. Red875]|uniref:ABC transporter permease n=2 Tax=Geomesophilobacter sediminis TaxID=2798584 RepID=A0A8J7JAW3_9BACT|nr:ABC transporter permease [Geomesophilobacter sediminis]